MKVFRVFLDMLFPPRSDQALVDEATVAALGMHARARTMQSGVSVLLPYREHLVRAAILEAKFRNSERAQRLLGGVLADYLLECSAGWEDIVLVPVPLSRERKRERGYNQTERIARAAGARVPGVRIEPGRLARLRDTLPQTSLGGAARKENLRDAFLAGADTDPSHTYIVFDDVLTTGSTLSAAMDALRRAGAKRICGLALAH